MPDGAGWGEGVALRLGRRWGFLDFLGSGCAAREVVSLGGRVEREGSAPGAVGAGSPPWLSPARAAGARPAGAEGIAGGNPLRLGALRVTRERIVASAASTPAAR